MSRIWKLLCRFRHRQEGASAVEFAIVVPVFLMILFGIIIFGGYLSVVHSVQQLAAEAARASIGGLSDNERTALANSNIQTQAGFYPFIERSRLVVESASTNAATSTFTVRLRYDASQSFIYSLPSLVPMPSPQIVRSAAIQRGGY
ncbi:TadE/TadG family type IV pilus assembly protein [Phreatobacter stygius]|uniref:Pilus assembly protein n=1 Tax=Phreatobacter stygius TaxID=1940610 RepID=A0A4D7AS38_9HYPH|nr:TadE/TadG family type IV pilus assembly protein [Phreatobacter stygius]QCI64264.1 pilus assembly protein [Phreatobacter stygius]